jgi:hypothetical protein
MFKVQFPNVYNSVTDIRMFFHGMMTDWVLLRKMLRKLRKTNRLELFIFFLTESDDGVKKKKKQVEKNLRHK